MNESKHQQQNSFNPPVKSEEKRILYLEISSYMHTNSNKLKSADWILLEKLIRILKKSKYQFNRKGLEKYKTEI